MVSMMSNQSKSLSWQTRVLDKIRASNIPRQIAYLSFFVIALLLMHLAPWWEGKLPWGYFDVYQLNPLVWFLYIFFSIDYFLNYAGAEIEKFRLVVDLSEQEMEGLREKFTTLPPVPGIVATVLGLLFSILAFKITYPWDYAQAGITRIVTTFVSTFLMSFAFYLFYLLYRQDMLVSGLYSRVNQINIFKLEPIYTFSGITSRIGFFSIAAGVLAYLTNVVFSPVEPAIRNFIFFGLIFFGLAIASFFLPSWGMHTRLKDEKTKAKNENDERIYSVFLALHEHVDGRLSVKPYELKDQLSSLLTFREEIAKISTWPWDTATLRGFLSALLLPIILGLIEGLISRLINT